MTTYTTLCQRVVGRGLTRGCLPNSTTSLNSITNRVPSSSRRLSTAGPSLRSMTLSPHNANRSCVITRGCVIRKGISSRDGHTALPSTMTTSTTSTKTPFPPTHRSRTISSSISQQPLSGSTSSSIFSSRACLIQQPLAQHHNHTVRHFSTSSSTASSDPRDKSFVDPDLPFIDTHKIDPEVLKSTKREMFRTFETALTYVDSNKTNPVFQDLQDRIQVFTDTYFNDAMIDSETPLDMMAVQRDLQAIVEEFSLEPSTAQVEMDETKREEFMKYPELARVIDRDARADAELRDPLNKLIDEVNKQIAANKDPKVLEGLRKEDMEYMQKREVDRDMFKEEHGDVKFEAGQEDAALERFASMLEEGEAREESEMWEKYAPKIGLSEDATLRERIAAGHKAKQEEDAEYQARLDAMADEDEVELVLRRVPAPKDVAAAADVIHIGGVEGRRNYYFDMDDQFLSKYLPEGVAGKLQFEHATLLEKSPSLPASMMVRGESLQAISDLEALKERSFVRGPDNVGSILLAGAPGTGKSSILTTVVAWARANDWLVAYIPDGDHVVNTGVIQESDQQKKRYDQPELAVQMLEQFKSAHADKLSQLPVRGRCRIGTFAADALSPTEADGPEGHPSLLDLIEYGAANDQSATEVVVRVRGELSRVTKFPVLIAVDDVNYLNGKRTGYFDPEFTGFTPGRLPASSLTLAALFADPGNHGLANGTTISAVRSTNHNNDKLVKKLESSSNGSLKVYDIEGYSRSEFASCIDHYRSRGWVESSMNKGTMRFVYWMTGGRGQEVFKFVSGSML